MKKEDFKRTASYGGSLSSEFPEKSTAIERFIYWFRGFLENSE